jgi:FkbM family methyltransferase
MEIDPNDLMDRLFYLGTYDRWLLSTIRMCVRPGDTCLDIGAHKGYVTLHLAKAVGPAGRIYAFEPDPRARAVLEKHCARNRLGNVSILPYALGARNGTTEFLLSNQLGWSSQYLNKDTTPTVVEKIQVPLRRFDDLVESGAIELGTNLLSFVKIDAEGAEYDILSGMEGTIRQWAPILWMEVNPESLATAGVLPQDLHEMLVVQGLSVYALERKKTTFLAANLAFTPLTDMKSVGDTIRDVVALKRPAAHEASLTPAQIRYEIELLTAARRPQSWANGSHTHVGAEEVR